jgi:hypothetical protein
MNNQFYFPHLPNNLLLDILQEPEFAESLVNLLDNKRHSNLKVTPKPHSIEISNEEINISIVIYSGFELNEWLTLKNQPNLHLICMSSIITEMVEFKDMNIKYIDKLTWLFNLINKSENELIKKIKRLKDLPIT